MAAGSGSSGLPTGPFSPEQLVQIKQIIREISNENRQNETPSPRHRLSLPSVATQIAGHAVDDSSLRSSRPASFRGKRRRSQILDLHESSTEDAPASTNDDWGHAKRRRAPKSSTKSSTTPVVSNLRDTLHPNLLLVLIGLNPGIMTAKAGHPYCHPSNGFWKILHTSGITPIRHRPQDHASLPDLYGIGNTNICARPSRQGSELTKAELRQGAKTLDEKIAIYRPESVCITGKGVWRAVWSYKAGKSEMPREGPGAFRYGWQDEEMWLGRIVDAESGETEWKGSRTFVAPSTSGLNAGMSQAEKEQIWRPIGEWMKVQRQNRGTNTKASI